MRKSFYNLMLHVIPKSFFQVEIIQQHLLHFLVHFLKTILFYFVSQTIKILLPEFQKVCCCCDLCIFLCLCVLSKETFFIQSFTFKAQFLKIQLQVDQAHRAIQNYVKRLLFFTLSINILPCDNFNDFIDPQQALCQMSVNLAKESIVLEVMIKLFNLFFIFPFLLYEFLQLVDQMTFRIISFGFVQFSFGFLRSKIQFLQTQKFTMFNFATFRRGLNVCLTSFQPTLIQLACPIFAFLVENDDFFKIVIIALVSCFFGGTFFKLCFVISYITENIFDCDLFGQFWKEYGFGQFYLFVYNFFVPNFHQYKYYLLVGRKIWENEIYAIFRCYDVKFEIKKEEIIFLFENMLTEQMLKSLGFKGQFQHQIEKPSFLKTTPLWVKDKDHPEIENNWDSLHKHQFVKIGKTFGLEVNRFLEYKDGILLYFENQDDKKHKGFCNSENIYLCYVKLDDRYLVHLSNGHQSSQFYFKNMNFIELIKPSFLKKVIQLNFTEKYHILEIIGKGSFSNVYLARSKSDNRKYAVKIVNKKDKHGSPTKQIVEEEKKILGILNSSYICKMIEFFEDDLSFIFVLEYIQGKQLMQHLKEKSQPFSFKQAHFILKHILKAIRDCHSANIIHRDLKPQNVMINPKTLEPVLIDFGLSLVYSPSLEKKKFRKCGTIGYMAHEVLQNTADKCKPYDQKCDMFSFGIIFHMLLLGKNPLKGKCYQQTCLNNAECNFQLDKEYIVLRYGTDCYQLLSSLLSKDPKIRVSAQEALKAPFFQKDVEKMEKKQKFEDSKEEDIDESSGSCDVAKKMQKMLSLKTKATLLGSETKS